MKKLLQKTKAASKTCEAHWTAIIGFATPAAAAAAVQFPLLHDYLPPDIYKAGFIAIVIANILVQIKKAPADDESPPK